MIAVDTNILVYAHRKGLPQHAAANEELVRLAEGHALWGIPVFCLGEFVRVITHSRFTPRYSPEEACEAVEALLASPSLRVLHPGPRFTPLFLEAIRQSGVKGNLVFDAQIVAICRELGVRALLTEDRDFARFPDFVTKQL